MKIFKTGGKETMKKRRFAQLVLMITMLFCLTFGTVCAQAATTATTTTAKAAVKNGWKKEGGQYYYYIKGKKVTNKLKKINGAIYYLGSNGARKTGWYTVKSGNTYKTMQFASNGKYTGKSKKANAELMPFEFEHRAEQDDRFSASQPEDFCKSDYNCAEKNGSSEIV